MSNSGRNLAPDSANTRRDLPKDFAIFLDFFVQATAMVGEDYFRLPVAGREDLLYRERVYCYELYHYLRLTMEHSGPSFPYTLCGELDKSGHPYIRGNSLDRVKPDFLVHKPLSMTLNLVAIEVKPVARTIRGGNQTGVVGWRAIGQKEIEKDLKTLTAFHRAGSYHRAIYLIYGNDDKRFQRIRAKAAVLSDRLGTEEIDLDLIDLYLHQESGQPASRQAWL